MLNKKQLKSFKTELSKLMYSESMRDSVIGNISEWIPSDFLDFNRICSGDLNKCLPAGKTLCLAGPEHSGKSMIIANLFKHAQENGYTPILFETEGAWTDEFCERWGVDPDNMLYNYVTKTEDLIIGIEKLKEHFKEMQDKEEIKVIMALDSLGNLDTYKKETDAAKKRAVLDQGLLQRYIKSLFKTIKEVTVLFNIPFIFANHLVSNPNEMYSVEDMVGGKAPKLQSDIIAILRNKPLREGEAKTSPVIGADVYVKTRKNRFHPPFQTGRMEINFQEGINPYAGIIDVAIDLELFVREGNKYWVGDEKVWGKDLIDHIDEDLIAQLNEKIGSTGYSTLDETEEEGEE